MPAHRRSVPAYSALALVVAALSLLAGSGPAQAATNPISISVKVGYAGFVRNQQWMPVTIDVTNKGDDVDGTIEVSATTTNNGPPIGSAIYEAHVSLPSGSTKHLRTYVLEDVGPSPVSVRIVKNGRVLASAGSATASAAAALIGVLSDQSTSLDNFSAVHPAGISASVAHLTLEDVGDSAILLRAFDILAIDDFATDTLTAAQRSAITDYVQNGGALLIGTGGSWRKTLAGLSSAMLPMQVQGTTTLAAVQALGGLSGVEVATGTLDPAARPWLSEGDTPLLIERTLGSGLVTMGTFDWNQEPVAGWGGVNPLLRQVLVRNVFFAASGQSVTSGFNGPFGATGSSISQRSYALSQALASLPALDLPSLVVIGLLVLAYVLLVGPINYFGLRVLHRRALTWITVPLIAIVASAGAFGAGILTKGRSVQTNQISMIHLQPGWDRAYQESYTGILTPTRGDYEVSGLGGHQVVGPIGSYNGGPVGATSDVIRVSTDNNTVTLPNMTAFALRGFATESFVDAPHLVATAKLANGMLTGTVRNDTTMRFTDALAIAGDGYQLLPALPPGATATFSFAPKVSNPYLGPPAFSTIYANYFNGPQPNQPTDAEREGVEKSQILTLLAGSNIKGVGSTMVPMVVAWTRQPYQHVAVAGSQPHASAETAVVLSLAVGDIGAGSVPAGLVVSRYVDIEGDTQPGPPGGVMMQNGTVTYDFTPQLAAGTRLTAASLDSSNQSPKGVFPGSTQGGLQAEVWDWTQSAWVGIAFTLLGTTTLDASAVNPDSGEVRLRLHITATTMLLGSISLTGTVK